MFLKYCTLPAKRNYENRQDIALNFYQQKSFKLVLLKNIFKFYKLQMMKNSESNFKVLSFTIIQNEQNYYF